MPEVVKVLTVPASAVETPTPGTIVPACGTIEMAYDSLARLDAPLLAAQLKELRETGNQEAPGVGATPFEDGYLLGLQTARMILLTTPKAVKAGVTL